MAKSKKQVKSDIQPPNKYKYLYLGLFIVVIVVAIAVLLVWGKGSSSGQAVATACVDPDNTYVPNKAENVKSYNKDSAFTKTSVLGKTDYCMAKTKTNTTVIEAHCRDKTTAAFVPITCPKGSSCVDGACVKFCTPKECVYQDYAGGVKDCGIKNNGCGGTINCNFQKYAGGLECPTGLSCQNGACVTPAPTCTAGPTGKIKCVTESDYFYAKKEYQSTNCSTYLATSWSDKDWCGYNSSSCIENVGCCKDNPRDSYCNGNILTNTTINSCTGIIQKHETNCANVLNYYYFGKSLVCGFKTYDWGNSTSCFESCTPGEEVIQCNDYGSYKYACDKEGLGFSYKNSVGSCPVGTSCQDKNQYGNGICKSVASSSSSSGGGGNYTNTTNSTGY